MHVVNGQAVWLPCGYLLHCTEYWPGGMVAMWLLTALHRVLARRYGCHVITAVHRVLARRYGCHEITLTAMQSTGQAIWLPCDYLLQCTEYWSGNIVAMWLLTAFHRVLARLYGCHVITYCISQSFGQAVWLPCDYLPQCTEYWPGNIVAMSLLTAVHIVLARRYGCHEIILTAMHRVLVRQYGCHVITYCSEQSIGQAVWLSCDYYSAQNIGQAVWLPYCDRLYSPSINQCA